MKQSSALALVGLVILILAGMHLLALLLDGRSWQLERLFNLQREGNIPTWVSSVMFFMAAHAAFVTAGNSAGRDIGQAWFLTAGALAFMSCDEVVMFHENFSGVIERNFMPAWFLDALHRTSWPVLFGPFILAFVVWVFPELKRSFDSNGSGAICALSGLLLFFGGAVGVEMLTNLITEDTPMFWRASRLMAEELMELVGVGVLMVGLTSHANVLRLSHVAPGKEA
ncbi:MAG: hypothetical protein Q8R76_11175 [Candidatus Omnitrophota bacterium]|nr:hypothetical protein [Candidatus Omnitrophota bacterium]